MEALSWRCVRVSENVVWPSWLTVTRSRSETLVIGHVDPACLTFTQLPLIMYPHTRRQVTPRKRAVGIRPRTFNYYCKLVSFTMASYLTI